MACHLESGGMLKHDVVGVNCEKCAATENQSEAPSIWAKGCLLDGMWVYNIT